MRYKFLVCIFVFLLFILINNVVADTLIGNFNITGNNPKTGKQCNWTNGTNDGDYLAGFWGSLPVNLGNYDLSYLHLVAKNFYYDDAFLITLNDKVIFISVGRDIQTYRTPPPNIYLGVNINNFEWNPPKGVGAYSAFPLTPKGSSQTVPGVNFPCSQWHTGNCPNSPKDPTHDLNLSLDLTVLPAGILGGDNTLKIYALGDNDASSDCTLNNFTLNYGYYVPNNLPVCGNNILETGEECDDGNLISGDGCDSSCMIEAHPEICDNEIDDDGDGLIDCLDNDCPPCPINLTSAYWANSSENEISQAYVGDVVKLIAVGAPDSTLVNFSIYTISNSLVTSKVSSINEGVANVSWTLSVTGNYYFNASIVSDPGISIISGNLNVISGLCSPTNCQQTLDSLDIDGAVDIWGSWPNGTCSGNIDCDCEAGEIKIEDPGLNPNNNGGVCMNININYCSDYNITNFGSLLAAEGNCTEDTQNVAKNTIEDEQGITCGSLDSNGCIMRCLCSWSNNQCGGSTSHTNCPNPGDNGICNFLRQEVKKDCDQPPIGWLNQTNYYQWVGANPDPECKDRNILTRCISRTTLDFISTSALIVAVIIIVIFYLIVIRKPGKKKK